MATLSLRPRAADEDKGTDDVVETKGTQEPIKFQPEEYFVEVGGVEGVRYLQGKNFFNNAKLFVREAPKSQWLKPLTQEQETARKRQALQNKKFLIGGSKAREAAIPQTVINAERENARARQAETQAA